MNSYKKYYDVACGEAADIREFSDISKDLLKLNMATRISETKKLQRSVSIIFRAIQLIEDLDLVCNDPRIDSYQRSFCKLHHEFNFEEILQLMKPLYGDVKLGFPVLNKLDHKCYYKDKE